MAYPAHAPMPKEGEKIPHGKFKGWTVMTDHLPREGRDEVTISKDSAAKRVTWDEVLS